MNAPSKSGAQASWLDRLAFAGCTAQDSEEERRKKAVLTLTSLAKCSVCAIWYGAYYLVGAPLAALGPIVYQALTIINVAVFFRSKDFASFRNIQTAAILLAPWWMHLAIGGYNHSAALLMWPLLAPLTALLFHGTRQSVYWLIAYLSIIVISGVIDPFLPTPATTVGATMNLIFFCMNIAMPSIIAYLAVMFFSHVVDLEKKVQLRLNNEIADLNNKLQAENFKLGTELDIAKRLQMMVLPKKEELAKIPKFDIAGYMRPADQVGGDYYDVLHLGSHIKVGIGDVTGHGLEAGLVMLMVQSIARTLHEAGQYDPVQFLKCLNQTVYKNMRRVQTDKTLSLAFLDIREDKVVLSGHHEEVVLIRGNNTIERIDTCELGFAVGMEPDISNYIGTREFVFGKGDTIVLYTDGVTEATNEKGEFYGIERLCESIQKKSHQDATDLSKAVVGDLFQFIGNARIHDDISVVVIRHP